MGYEALTGLNVSNSYGARRTGGSVGVERTDDSMNELSIYFTGASLNQTFMPPVVVPSGAHIRAYRLVVHEAFNITGTSPTVLFGGTAPATNGVVLTEAELEAVGTKVPASTGAGTWSTSSATGTTAAQKVAKALGGTSPVVDATVGKATLVVEYFYKARA